MLISEVRQVSVKTILKWSGKPAIEGLDQNPFNLVERDFVARPVVELRRPR